MPAFSHTVKQVIYMLHSQIKSDNKSVVFSVRKGSGKTYTMMGSEKELGLIPRICEEMFNRMKLGQVSGTGYKTCVSYLEIYNERVKDLLGSDNSGHGLRVREHRTTGPYVEDLSQHPVSDYEEILVSIRSVEIINRMKFKIHLFSRSVSVKGTFYVQPLQPI